MSQGFGYSQELPIRLCPRVEPALGFLPADMAVVPGHPLVGCGGHQLLHLGSLADDGLFQGIPLGRSSKRDLLSSCCSAEAAAQPGWGTWHRKLGISHR